MSETDYPSPFPRSFARIAEELAGIAVRAWELNHESEVLAWLRHPEKWHDVRPTLRLLESDIPLRIQQVADALTEKTGNKNE